MRNLLLFLAVNIFVFSAYSQTSQTRASEDIRFGVKAGVNFANFTGDDTDNLSSRTGFHFGGIVNIPISDAFSVQPEVLYSDQGAEYTMSEGYDGKFVLSYLNIPVMAQLRVAQGLNLEAGPQIGFLLCAEDQYSSSGDSGEDDIKDDVKGTDFGLNVGINYTMESGLGIGTRYNLGLSELPEDSEGGNWKNGVFQFYLAYFF
ncbi:porin family protein [uncultured Algibacter sp.]|uniref:porin family protein n=1 Tax=uncultured Algibacter sp. TaxID=298659 RepID=UPI00260B3292|nr:porin family protein [uncultured Algibacter sp.]